MHLQRATCLFLSLLLSGSALFAPGLSAAQPPQELVFSISSADNFILRANFNDRTTAIVNTSTDANVRKALEGLTVRDDAPGVSLIVADYKAGKILFYSNAQGPNLITGQVISTPAGQLKSPRGVSLDADRNILVVDSPGPASAKRQVWKIPFTGGSGVGGYGAAVQIDRAVPSSMLEETRVVNFNKGVLQTGDILILSSNPAKVLRYSLGQPCGGSTSCAVPFIELTGLGVPSGIAIDSKGEVLISTTGGTVLRFDANGAALSPDFASGVGTGKVKVVVGVQSGVERAFFTDESGDELVRYDIGPAGTGVNPVSLTQAQGVKHPNGVGIASTNQITPAGTNVTIRPAPSLEITFGEVTASGTTTATILEFTRPHSGEFLLTEVPALVAAGIPAVKVPSYIQGLQKNSQETFTLYQIETTALFIQPAELHALEELLGFPSAQCAGQTGNQQNEPRLYYAPEIAKGEPAIVDDNFNDVNPSFTDISNGCGSHKGGSWCFSLFLTGKDSRTIPEITDFKLTNLKEEYDQEIISFVHCPCPPGFPCAPVHCPRNDIQDQIHAAVDAFNPCTSGLNTAGCNVQGAMNALQQMIQIVQTATSQGEIFNDPANHIHYSGQLIARPQSAQYMLIKLGAIPPE